MIRRFFLLAALALPFGGLLSGCGEKASIGAALNQPPTVRITNAPRSARDTVYYAVTLNWIGHDPDGRVEYFLYAVDPPSAPSPGNDTVWVRTERSEQIILFNSTRSDPARVKAEDPHVFVIKAVDDRGAQSAPAVRAFWSQTDAPSVQISAPRPRVGQRAYVTPAIRITWSGDDFDGVFTKKPVKYKYKLLTDLTEVTQTTARTSPVGPDTVRRFYAPLNFAGWDSTTADTTQVQFTNLVPDNEYVFCVIAIDEAGAYSPVFTFSTNMLWFRVTFAGPRNPRITMFNDFFQYTYPQGSYEPLNPARWVNLEVPANQPITFNWFAEATDGSAMRSYRWAVDILDLTDETPRQSLDDISRWSSKDLGTTSATIGPYAGSDTIKTFYLEAEDINGLVSLGIIKFKVIQATFEKPLLVVKDYRLQVDSRSPGQTLCLDPPRGQWPTVAELDTFLFARGGFPWRCYPPGIVSKPGIFAGYTFDTLGTRSGQEDLTVKLSTLGRYRKVIWISDRNAAAFDQGGNSSTPMGALKYMSGPNRANTLATFVRQGGKAWLLGGGAGASTNIWYDRQNNNTTQPAPSETYSVDNQGELGPGRFMYDLAKWQSEFKAVYAPMQINRLFGRNSALPPYSTSTLPTQLAGHSLSAGDSFPPNRDSRFSSDFYYTRFYLEYLSRPNNYQEDFDPGPGENFQSALDTLYYAVGASLVPPASNPRNVAMTVYPAWQRDPSAKIIFTGFDIWSWRRTQCKSILDFVLQQLWGEFPNPAPMVRATPARFPAGAARAVAPPERQGSPSITSTRSLRTAPSPGR
uniref:Fibronectin type III domain-containing protein n=1 Tax=Eiseniibacteriota bacterium TaxID=2212470 RepID=A0A832I3D8_UNCEI